MTIARQERAGNLNPFWGFVTLIYGIGQILGPALTSMLGNGNVGARQCHTLRRSGAIYRSINLRDANIQIAYELFLK